MKRVDQVRLMAKYNEWMNVKLYAAAAGLPAAEILADRKAFFGSLFITLAHIARADTIWLTRFARHPAGYPALESLRGKPMPPGSEAEMFADFEALCGHRVALDRMILEWADEVAEAELDHVLDYSTLRGVPARYDFYSLVLHFFNHQTHHRGQATTLFSQAGVDVGSTDLLTIVREAD